MISDSVRTPSPKNLTPRSRLPSVTPVQAKIIFACTGVTEGNLLRGVRFFGEGVRTESLIMTLDERQVRFIDTVHLDKRPDVKVRFA